MSKEKELRQALDKLINQTEQALDEGRIYGEDFKKQLKEARMAAESKTEVDQSYPDTQEFHILQQ